MNKGPFKECSWRAGNIHMPTLHMKSWKPTNVKGKELKNVTKNAMVGIADTFCHGHLLGHYTFDLATIR